MRLLLMDMYCSGFISTEKVPDKMFVAAGANSPDQVRYYRHRPILFSSHGAGTEGGGAYQVSAPRSRSNHNELFRDKAPPSGNRARLTSNWDTQSSRRAKDTAIAIPELSCADFFAWRYCDSVRERETPVFRKVSLDIFSRRLTAERRPHPPGKEFDSFIGSKYKVYLNFGADKGLQASDYLRATRTYSYISRP